MNKKQERQAKITSFVEDKIEVSVSDILSFLSVDIDRKTLQRDLKELEEKLLILKKGMGKSTIYSLSTAHEILKEVDVEKYFSIPYVKREIKESFNFEIFKILEGDIFNKEEKKKLENLHNEFIRNFSKYNSQTLINKEFERIMIEFSWKSSEIEGNTYSLLSTEALIRDNIKEEGKTKEETQMILNHKDAFNEAIQNKQRFLELDYSDIEYIHGVLTKDLGISRNIRNGIVGIVGTKYKPLENSFQLKEVLQEMTNLINKKNSFFEKVFLSLILISYIQAFEDGNKRTARMMSNAILLANNSIPLSYRIVDVKEYKKASLLFYEINNISYFKQIFIEQFEDAVNNYFN
ncbi:Fic family protein [Candidatus Kuenenbacteria bacterium]|nr:Fic family protein [Candidatus Kuenenbacteria bacterium]